MNVISFLSLIMNTSEIILVFVNNFGPFCKLKKVTGGYV